MSNLKNQLLALLIFWGPMVPLWAASVDEVPERIAGNNNAARAAAVVLLLLGLMVVWRMVVNRRWLKDTASWIPQPGAPEDLLSYERPDGTLILVRPRWDGTIFLSVFSALWMSMSAAFVFSGEAWGWLIGILFALPGLLPTSELAFQLFAIEAIYFEPDALRFHREALRSSEDETFSKETIRHIVMREVEDDSGPNSWSVVVQAAEALDVFHSRDEETAQWVSDLLQAWCGAEQVTERVD